MEKAARSQRACRHAGHEAGEQGSNRVVQVPDDRLKAQQEATEKKVEEIVGEYNETLDRVISDAS